IPDAKSKLCAPGGFKELTQPRVLWQHADLGIPRELTAVGKNPSHEPGTCLVGMRGIVFVVCDTHTDEPLNPPRDRTSQRVGCVDPLRPPAPRPVENPANEEDIMQLLSKTAFDKPDSFHVNATMSRKLETLIHRGAKKEHIPAPVGQENR